jgi:hypothetical protein
MEKIEDNLQKELVNNDIISTPYFSEEAIREWGKIEQNVINHYNSYVKTIGQVNAIGPIEKHPYLEKYKEDFDLSRKFLVLGTFPGNSYFHAMGLTPFVNQNIINYGANEIDFYCGSRRTVWRYILGVENNDFNTNTIQQRLEKNNISVSDVFNFIQRDTMNDSSSSRHKNIVLNSRIKEVFTADSKVDTLLTTSGSLSDIGNNALVNTVKGLQWIFQNDEYEISGDYKGNGDFYPFINDGVEQALIQQQGKPIWWLKNEEKKIKIINLPGFHAQGDGRTSFYRKWIQYKAQLAFLPNENDNLHTIMNQYPDIFGIDKEGRVKLYWTDVCKKALDGTLHEI